MADNGLERVARAGSISPRPPARTGASVLVIAFAFWGLVCGAIGFGAGLMLMGR